jgi:hypothetical protein
MRGRRIPLSARDGAQLQTLQHFELGSFISFNSSDERSLFLQQLEDLFGCGVTVSAVEAAAFPTLVRR